MKLRVAGAMLAAFALTLSVATPASASGVGHLRVATYNIHAGAGEDGVFDLGRTASAIRALDADVVGLEEVDVHWGERSGFADEAGELARALRMHVFFAPIYDNDPPSPGAPRERYGVAILSRFPILAAENHQITRLSTQVPDPVPAPAPGFAEVLVAVRGLPVHVYATHLDYRPDPGVRAQQVHEMLGILAHDHGPRVLTGDFNAQPGAPELDPLWTVLRDSAPDGPATYPAIAPVSRIDLVTVAGLRVLDSQSPASTASDHRPVVADLSLF